VTVCTRNRASVLASVQGEGTKLSPLGEIVRRCWLEIPGHYPTVSLDTFIVMPNHIHGIVWLGVGAGHAPPLHRVVGSFKSAASRACGRPLWQRSFYDRVIRNDDELRGLREYVGENPLRWALDLENPARR
jgi:putative transposase